MNRFLTAYTVIVEDDGTCTVPPSPIDGDLAEGDCHYPDVREALSDLFDAVIEGEMPCRVTFNFERRADQPPFANGVKLGGAHE